MKYKTKIKSIFHIGRHQIQILKNLLVNTLIHAQMMKLRYKTIREESGGMSFTSQVEEDFPKLKFLRLIILFALFSIICLLLPQVPILYLH